MGNWTSKREVIQYKKVWLVGEDLDHPGTFQIVEAKGHREGDGWIVIVGCFTEYLLADKVHETRRGAEERVRKLLTKGENDGD